MVRRASSAARTVWEFISKARWVRMRSMSSRVGSTLEPSYWPWMSWPKFVVPGMPEMGGPEALVSTKRFSPICLRPAGLMKFWVSICVS